jgi:hypothetical protein
MCTGFVGTGLGFGFAELEDAELDELVDELGVAVFVTVFVAPLPVELQALTSNAVAAANPNTTRLERRRNGLCTPTTVSESRGQPLVRRFLLTEWQPSSGRLFRRSHRLA